jgi:hypothetical protein
MKDWPWTKWVGKIILLVLALAAFLVKEFGVNIPWWMIILPAATQVAQWFLALIPGMGWQGVIGKLLLLIVSIVELILAELGIEVQLWMILAPMIGALAQYLISMIPAPE